VSTVSGAAGGACGFTLIAYLPAVCSAERSPPRP
jgi:hypothetical protein